MSTIAALDPRIMIASCIIVGAILGVILAYALGFIVRVVIAFALIAGVVVAVAPELVFGATPCAGADPIPYFKPDAPAEAPIYGPTRPHPIASECAIDDMACTRAHDEAVIQAAAVMGIGLCAQAAETARCQSEVIQLEIENVLPEVDPCLWVVRIEGRFAVLLNPTTGVYGPVRARPAWRPQHYVGACAEKREREVQTSATR